MLHRALTLLTAIGLDLVLGEPPESVNPMAGVGKLVDQLEVRWQLTSPARQIGFGAGLAAATAAAATAAPGLLSVLPKGPLRFLARAWLLKTTFSIRGLFQATRRVQTDLEASDLAAARLHLRSLVRRDTSTMNAGQITAAAIESLAEKLSDAVVAPFWYYMQGGVSRALMYRALTSLDTMLGERNHSENLGKAASKLDEVLHMVPARLTALGILGATKLEQDDPKRVAMAVWKYRGAPRDPNQGWPMSAMAGALEVQLDKPGDYHLGDKEWPEPEPHDIDRALKIAGIVVGVAAGLTFAREVFRFGR